MKFNKITIIEIITILIILSALVIYFIPKFTPDKEAQKAAKLKANNAIFTAKVVEEFASNKNAKASDIAKKVVENLNKTTKNPYDKNLEAYTLEGECASCSNITYDDSIQMVIVTSYDKKGGLIARTVIKPPSFVTFNKFEENQENK